MVTTMHKSATCLVLVCVFGLMGCTSDVEKCVQAGLKQDENFSEIKWQKQKDFVEYRYRLKCLHGPSD